MLVPCHGKCFAPTFARFHVMYPCTNYTHLRFLFIVVIIPPHAVFNIKDVVPKNEGLKF
ncbi:hypothetical protein KsCSTR_03420 [Candidatus Kuenenia stuttgartiensis]|uniref:Uncharacterized protein n=1 Tax=Kuenenia stuttgartiensis TaxID=174633 RepID=Q1PXY2_KUEST|nr:hypothetical protein KsCSTR_03420 [Candidatus Kuenenia stuttgartiensis]CAJ72891.1 unknown protein [Candidatus Kuenenia stuttgartiensis]